MKRGKVYGSTSSIKEYVNNFYVINQLKTSVNQLSLEESLMFNKLLTSTLKSLVILLTYWLSMVRVFNESHHFSLLITFFFQPTRQIY